MDETRVVFGYLLIMLWLASMAPDKQSASPTSGMRGHSG